MPPTAAATAAAVPASAAAVRRLATPGLQSVDTADAAEGFAAQFEAARASDVETGPPAPPTAVGAAATPARPGMPTRHGPGARAVDGRAQAPDDEPGRGVPGRDVTGVTDTDRPADTERDEEAPVGADGAGWRDWLPGLPAPVVGAAAVISAADPSTGGDVASQATDAAGPIVVAGGADRVAGSGSAGSRAGAIGGVAAARGSAGSVDGVDAVRVPAGAIAGVDALAVKPQGSGAPSTKRLPDIETQDGRARDPAADDVLVRHPGHPARVDESGRAARELQSADAALGMTSVETSRATPAPVAGVDDTAAAVAAAGASVQGTHAAPGSAATSPTAPAPSDAPGFAEATLPAPFGAPEFAPALARQVSVFVADGVQHARLHLNPGDMGPISLRIAVDGTTAQVVLAAERADTRQALEQALPQLAGALRDSGLTLTGGGVFDRPRDGRDEAPPAGPAARSSPAASAGEAARDETAARALAAQRRPRGVLDVFA